MIDILICRIKYPNDPTNNINPHQHFVGVLNKEYLILYSVSSILGKEKRIYNSNGNFKNEYYILKDNKQIECKLRVPSFINCTQAYRIHLDGSVDVSKLNNRIIPAYIRIELEEKIDQLIQKNNHTTYDLDIEEFKKYNKRCII